MRKYENYITIINYAVYSAEVIVKHGEPEFNHDIYGMWDMERYVSLLLGAIPRLTDDENGYSPKRINYIAHVDIPEPVQKAFSELSSEYSNLIRQVNPEYRERRTHDE